ncbi:MAG: ArnT family glycosyltransferase [Blastocatellia bacterium]
MLAVQQKDQLPPSITKKPAANRWGGFLRPWVLLAVLGIAIFVGAAKAPPALLDDADSAHAEVAREMALTDDWVTLKMDGLKYYEKDPLMYWTIAASFKVFGVNELAARLPIALSAVLVILAACALGKFMFGERAGLYGGLVMATSVGPFLFTRILIPDILLTALIAWAIYFFLRGMESSEPKSKLFLAFYASCGLAFLTKSMIGVVFPAGIILVWLILTRSLSSLKRARILSGLVLFLIIAAPWSVLAGIRNEHFLWFHYINEQVLRYLGKRYPKDYATVPFAVFYALHALWIFPWTVFFCAALTYVPRRLKDLSRDQRMTLLLCVWAVLIVAFFSFSTRQEYYTLPAIPALAILCGRAIGDLERSAREGEGWGSSFFYRSIRAGQIVLGFIGVAAAAAAITILIINRGVHLNGDIATALTSNPQEYALSLGHIFDLTPRAFAALRAPVIGAGLAMSIGCLASLILFKKRRVFASAAALAAMMVAMFYWTHESLKVFQPYLSSQEIASRVMQSFRPGDRIIINGEYESGSTLNFYTHEPVYMLNHRSSNLWYGSYLPDAPMRFYTDDTFRDAWSGNNHIFLDTDASDAESIRTLVSPQPVFQLAESGDKLLLSNHP